MTQAFYEIKKIDALLKSLSKCLNDSVFQFFQLDDECEQIPDDFCIEMLQCLFAPSLHSKMYYN